MSDTNTPETPGGGMGDDMEEMFLDGSSRQRGGAGRRGRGSRAGRARRVGDPEATLVEVLGVIAPMSAILAA